MELIKKAYVNAGPEQTRISDLGASQVIAFKTKSGKTGVIGSFEFDKVKGVGTTSPKKILRQVMYKVRSER